MMIIVIVERAQSQKQQKGIQLILLVQSIDASLLDNNTLGLTVSRVWREQE
jgi:hypothetical protein